MQPDGQGARWGSVRSSSTASMHSASTGAATLDAVADGSLTDEELTTARGVLQTPVLFMRAVFLWPEHQNAVTRVVARFFFPLLNIVLIVTGAAFIVLEQHESFLAPLTTFGDVVASIVCLAKLTCLYNSGEQLVDMRRRLQYGFRPMEALARAEAAAADARCVARARAVARRFVWVYAPLAASGIFILMGNALATPDERRVTVSVPHALTRCPYTFWVLFVDSGLALVSFFFYSVGYDTLFISMCMHLTTKCEILTLLLRRAAAHQGDTPQTEAWRQGARQSYEYWADDGSPFEAPRPPTSDSAFSQEVVANLRTCVLYHLKVINMRDEIEDIFAGVSLIQMAYILMGLGIPALRILHEKELKIGDVVFVLFYAAWNFSQLLFFCWFADNLAESSEEVAVAAYAAVLPPGPETPPEEPVPGPEDARARARRAARLFNLDKVGGTALQLMTLRAQRPLHLTAGRFANLTLVLYLSIIRKSQSIYSYLIRMR